MIELITIFQANHNWYLNKVYVNPDHIVSISDSMEYNKLLREGKIDLAFDNKVSFSKIKMNPATGYDEFIVVGSPSSIMEKVTRNTKQLLKG